MKLFTIVSMAAGSLAAMAGPVLAQSHYWWWYRPRTPVTTVSVPEIDASSGIVAIAAVLAALAFVWERRRRAA